MSLEYCYIGPAPTQTTTANAFQAITDPGHPLFNFPQSFIDDMQKLTALEIGKAVPYISLTAVDLQGQVIENFNVKYFHKMFDFNTIGTSKFTDRPEMSIKSLEITSDNKSGYIYTNEVKLDIKLHRPTALTSTGLIALLFPGFPLHLEYGWYSGDANPLLNGREKLLFSVRDYTISMNPAGESELTIFGTAFNDRFSNVLIGDLGIASNNGKVSPEEEEGIKRNKDKVDAAVAHIASITGENASNNYGLKKLLAESYRTLEDHSRGPVRRNYQQQLKTLRLRTFPKRFGRVRKMFVTLHDIVDVLCTPTWNAMLGSVFPASTFKLIYGSFNSKYGSYGDTCIADFPIDWDMFCSLMNQQVESGQIVPSIQTFLDVVVRNFIENDSYWRTIETSQDYNSPPDVIINFSNRYAGEERLFEISITDVTQGLPITSKLVPDGSAPVNDVENSFAQQGIPIFRLGHSNSFVNNISVSLVSSPQMKAVLIQRMSENRVISGRKSVPQEKTNKKVVDTPLKLPLQGDMTVLGSVEWKPHRHFFLSTGNYLIDACYKITGRRHIISNAGFKTTLSIYHH